MVILPLETFNCALKLTEVVLTTTHVEHLVVTCMLQSQKIRNLKSIIKVDYICNVVSIDLF